MNKMLRNALSLGAGVSMALSMAVGPAAAAQSLGMYQTEDRKMDFELILCGESETNMCVKLLDARGSAKRPRVVKMFGQYLVDNARPAGPNRWKGAVTYAGHTMNGTLTLTPAKFVMAGCAYIVICEDLTLIPAE
jgi:hypothetical protein